MYLFIPFFSNRNSLHLFDNKFFMIEKNYNYTYMTFVGKKIELSSNAHCRFKKHREFFNLLDENNETY